MNPITDWVSFDVETVGDKPCYALQPWRGEHHHARIRTYAITSIENGKLKSKATDKIFRAQLAARLMLWAQQGKTIVGWKVAFDIAWLISLGLEAEVFANKWLDAMVLWKNYDRTRKRYGLKEAVAIFYPQYAGYDEGVDFEGDVNKLMAYNKLDTEFTLLLALKFWGWFTDREKNALLIDMDDLPLIAKRNYEGLLVSLPAILKVKKKLQLQRQENYDKLLPHLPVNEKGEVLNLDSDKQLQKLLFEAWGLPIFKTTPKGAPSVDKESLLETSHLDERAKWVQQYRETTGLISKCVKAPILSAQYNMAPGGYHFKYGEAMIAHPEQKKSGTYTDRCTYSSNQEERIKRKKK